MRRVLTAVLLIISFPLVSRGQLGIISTVAGGGPNAPTALSAEIIWPAGVATDRYGNTYVCAANLDEVLKIDPAGRVTVVAGVGYAGYSGDGGPATGAALNLSGIYMGTTPAIALDTAGNLFISDTVNQVIRRVDARTGIITTVAGNGTPAYSGDGGPAILASLYFPAGMALDARGNLYVADGNGVIRRVDAVTGIITTAAGNHSLGCAYSGDSGPATAAGLCSPNDVALDDSGDLFIADTYNHAIRVVLHKTGNIVTVAGNGKPGYSGDGGPAAGSQLNLPCSVTFARGELWIADCGNEVIRRVDGASPYDINTIAGSGPGATGYGGFSGDGGPASSAQLNLNEVVGFSATGIAVDGSGDILIPDTYNNRVRKVDGKTGIISTFAGGGSGGDGRPATDGTLAFPISLAADTSGNLFVSDFDAARIRRIDARTGVISTVAGNGILVAGSWSDGVPATTTGLTIPRDLAVDRSGNLFLSEGFARVRRVDAVTGITSTVAGGGPPNQLGDGGPATSAPLDSPRGLAVDAEGNLFIADQGHQRVRRVDAATGIITTVAGNGTAGYSGDGGPAVQAELSFPRAVVVDRSGNLFIADSSNLRVRRVDAVTGIITTVAGNGGCCYSGDGGPASQAAIGLLYAVALDSFGDLFLSGYYDNERVRRVDAFTGTITTVAGNGAVGFGGDGGLANKAELDDPVGVALDDFGNLYIGDGANNRIRKVLLPPVLYAMPDKLTFPTQPVGTRSKPQVITVTNTGTPFVIYSLTIGGANAGDFAQTNDCGSGLAQGAHCHIWVTFAPTDAGARSAMLISNDNAPGSPHTLSFSGTACREPCVLKR